MAWGAPVNSAGHMADVMHTILACSPDLRSLSLLTGLESNPEDQITREHWFDLVAQLSSLSKYSGVDMFLDAEVFQALGRLPQLECLEIYSNHDPLPPLTMKFSHSAFPTLRRLLLQDLMLSNMNFILSVPLPFTQLTAIEIKFNGWPKDDDNTWAMCQFIPLLGVKIPNVTDLVLRFDLAEEPDTCDFCREAFEAIAALPLTRLIISNAQLSWAHAVGGLLKVWPKMEFLEWRKQKICMEQLHTFLEHHPICNTWRWTLK